MSDNSDPLEILNAIDRERGESFIGMIQANQVQRLRDEIVALREQEIDRIKGMKIAIEEAVDVPRRRIRDAALEEAARVADGYCTDRTDDVAAGIRALKNATPP